MIEDKIKRKRKELDESIENNDEYENVYRLSIELDDLITEFYKESQEKSTKGLFRKKRDFNKILYIA